MVAIKSQVNEASAHREARIFPTDAITLKNFSSRVVNSGEINRPENSSEIETAERDTGYGFTTALIFSRL